MTAGAILLAGGRASRLGGAAKPLLDVGGATLLERAIGAVRGCAPVTVVADPVPGVAGVSWAREDPPFSGPAAAVAAALATWDRDPEWTFLLACDLPGAAAAIARLRSVLAELPADAEGACLADAAARAQWLLGVHRTSVLRRHVAALPDAGRGAAVRALLDPTAIVVVPAPDHETHDVDTWEDLGRARARHARPEEER